MGEGMNNDGQMVTKTVIEMIMERERAREREREETPGNRYGSI